MQMQTLSRGTSLAPTAEEVDRDNLRDLDVDAALELPVQSSRKGIPASATSSRLVLCPRSSSRPLLFLLRGQFRATGHRIPFGFPPSLLPIPRRPQQPSPPPGRGSATATTSTPSPIQLPNPPWSSQTRSSAHSNSLRDTSAGSVSMPRAPIGSAFAKFTSRLITATIL
jgi:hypothetical protein